MIAMVEVSWQERDGSLIDTRARVEDRSPSGACIRLKKPIRVGSRVNVKWRWEQYQGITRYCRSDAGEYLLGIQRVTESAPVSSRPRVPSGESTVDEVRPLPMETIQSASGNKAVGATELHGSEFEPVSMPEVTSVPVSIPVPPAHVLNKPDSMNISRPSRPQEPTAPASPEIQTQKASDGEERILMSTKWLDSALKRQKQDAPSEAPNGKPNGAAHLEDPVHVVAALATPSSTNGAGKDPVRSQGDLQSMEDIYRSAGILNPRMGYSIRKVVEMLNSDHLRGMSIDAKRAAVLMALDSAGVTMDEILRDARQRQDALDAYEAGQRKQFEEYWARKAEGNAQIQKELERVTAQLLDRIKRSQDEVSLEKAAFTEWQRSKQQEADRISDAVALCSKLASPEPSAASLLAIREMDPAAKPS